MDRNTIIGVDPGVNGGIAVLRVDEGGSTVIRCVKNGDGWTLRTELETAGEGAQVFIEAVPKWCGEARFAVHAMTGSAMATMFGTFQLAVGVCVGFGIEPTLLVPVKWQNLVECRNRERLETTPWKNKLKARAAELYPTFPGLTLWNCNAILIAHAGALLGRRAAIGI